VSNSLRTEHITSSGGVVFRGASEDIEVLVCGRHSDKLWALPKGTPEANETLEQTALREVREETGVEVEVDCLVGEIKYWFSRPQEGVRYYKTVRHYLLRPIGGDPSQHDHEFDEVRWLPVNEALGLLTYPNEVRILNMALDLVRGREEGAAS
jgi:8-oxo-dGTP pyrophosphatase MutT (NUDIX family)